MAEAIVKDYFTYNRLFDSDNLSITSAWFIYMSARFVFYICYFIYLLNF